MMPCYQVNKVSVSFTAAHADLLEKAMQSLGWQYDWNVAKTFYRLNNGIELNLTTGQASVNQGQQPLLNELKRAYSHQAIKMAADLRGWKVNNLTANKGQLLKGVL
jgi:hypothetical protein